MTLVLVQVQPVEPDHLYMLFDEFDSSFGSISIPLLNDDYQR